MGLDSKAELEYNQAAWMPLCTGRKDGNKMIKLNKGDVVVFSGDSITDGNRGRSMDCNHIMGHGYQYMLAGRMGAENLAAMPKFVNKGYSGETVGQVYAKWNRDVLQYKPALISILLGTNDAEQGMRFIPDDGIVEKYLRLYRMLLEDTRRYLPKTKIVVCEPFFKAVDNRDHPYASAPHPICEEDFPLPNRGFTESMLSARTAIIRNMQSGLRQLAAELSCIFVPLQAVLDQAAQEAEGEYILWDGVHPTVVGHQLIARQWYQVVSKEL